MRQDALKIDNMLESWTRLTQISRLCAVVCLKFNQPEPFSKFSPFAVDSLLSGMLLKRGMGNGEWGMGNGEWGMGNGEWGMGNGDEIVVSGNT